MTQVQTATLNLNSLPNQPDLTTVLSQFKKALLADMCCHHIGTVQKFYPQTQTVDVTVNYTRTQFNYNIATQLYTPVQLPYPQLLGAPIAILGGGDTNDTYPVAVGDECIILFNDRDISQWYVGGVGAAPATLRLHSFADAIVLIGPRSLGQLLANYDPQRSVKRGGTAVLGVNPTNSKVLVANVAPTVSSGNLTYSTTLNTLLQNLITAIKAMTMTAGSYSVGLTAAIIAEAQSGTPPIVPVPVTGSSGLTNNLADLAAAATALGELLE